ncbi:isoaspartyl peptidase/L-asparaginase family protein [Kaistella antarctica]|uniref:Isoaspartyl peptidase n=1 Tax=Kaistella antarctica TaxID=266748 RepID=A0A448NPL2_9FLAO|nr:isoaspartyl peptidase/L-asparaginase [Kaistella antarctica]KEY19413.1 isoaspartyl peptidase [Kaistella antarctica]SEW06700.1 beta-aspartyl-peptidase (threonine type) [Kaistella antarctica]VEH97528.1 Isoaspartyl peptidase precursor [Kaistella antarctica]
MKKLLLASIVTFSLMVTAQKNYVLVIHGGAGTILKSNMTDEKEIAYKAKLTEALKAGYAEIQKGNTSIDAVAASIMIMEDSPLFNAGKGAVFTAEGKNELDASIMYGKDKSAGAIAGVHTIRNPIKTAIAVMQKSEHVMLSGLGAEQFAKDQNLEIVDPKYFWTKERWEGLQKLKQKEQSTSTKKVSQNTLPNSYEIDQKFGTVGAVALDKSGNITAGTSTGGMTNKKYGRIGDAPIIGAGTYANSQVGISATGWGEYFIRATAARTIAAKMEFQNKDIKTATQETIDEIEKMGGDGGLIALDKDGNIAMPFNTAGMYRGAITEAGEIMIEIYK